MPDFVDEKKGEMQARLRELKPLVEEYGRLEAAVAALEGVSGAATAARPARATRSRSTSSRSAKRRPESTGGTGKRGRPKGSGKRGKEALDLVRAQPGITIPEIAKKMGIQQNYLYRVLPGLAQDGLVRKDGKGWHAVDAA